DGASDVDFTDRRPNDLRVAVSRRVFHHEAGGEVTDHDTFPVSLFPFPAEHRSHRKRQRVVLPARRAALLPDRQPAPHGTSPRAHPPPSSPLPPRPPPPAPAPARHPLRPGKSRPGR